MVLFSFDQCRLMLFCLAYVALFVVCWLLRCVWRLLLDVPCLLLVACCVYVCGFVCVVRCVLDSGCVLLRVLS